MAAIGALPPMDRPYEVMKAEANAPFFFETHFGGARVPAEGRIQ